MAIKISEPIKITDTEFNKLITKMSGEFKKQINEFEKGEWKPRIRKNSPKKIKEPQRYILEFQNGTIIGAQTFVMSVGFGVGLLLTEPHYYRKEEERYPEILPDNCSEAILFTSFENAINKIAETLTKDTPIDFIDRGKGYKTTISFTETPEEAEGRVKLHTTLARLDQGKFSEKIRNQYNHACVITGCNIRAALQTAHIKPFSEDRDDAPENGLLLRADLHLLFDKGLMAIHPKTGKVHFKNTGEHYNKYDQKIVDISKASQINLTAHWQKYNE